MSAALSSLLERASIEDHEEVLKQCNQDIKQNKNSLETQHVKAIALLQLNRFEDALRAFDQAGDQLKSQAGLEYAYALYKSGKAEEAAEIVQDLDSRGAKQLHAQVAYRLEDFQTAASIYEALLKQPDDQEYDLRINLNATYAQQVWKRSGQTVKKTRAEREDFERFESAYNVACLAIARGELAQAEVLLKRATELVNASDELTTEQKEEELLSISVQQLYVLSGLGKEEAVKIAAVLSSESISDPATKRIAVINKRAVTSDDNPYLTQRLLASKPVLPPNDRFFGFQELLTDKNELAVDLASFKLEGIKARTSKQLATASSPSLDAKTNTASSVNAAANAQGQLGKEGIKAILPLLQRRPHDIGLLATIVQLYVLTGNNGAAIHVVEGFLKKLDDSKAEAEQDARFSPGLLAIVISLYSQAGRKTQVKDELSKAASYWKSKQKAPLGLLKAAAISLLKQGEDEDLRTAAEIFHSLHDTYPEDRIVIAGLAATSSITDSSTPPDTKFHIPLNRLISGIDIAALEQAGIPRSEQSTAAILKRKRAGAIDTKPKKKRLRKAQLPKDFDPERKPDPERWLPLRDRSTYRPKGKKGKQKQSTATQGSNEKAADAALTQEKTTVATASSGPNKAKKKKGKK